MIVVSNEQDEAYYLGKILIINCIKYNGYKVNSKYKCLVHVSSQYLYHRQIPGQRTFFRRSIYVILELEKLKMETIGTMREIVI